MKTWIGSVAIVAVVFVVGVRAQETNLPVQEVPVVDRSMPVAAPDNRFAGPPVVVVPATTAEVEVVETVIVTNIVTTLATNRVTRRQVVVSTNATLRRFMVDIDENQNPVRFTSVLSDGSVVVTPAGDVVSMTNREALSTFNGMLGDVIGKGRRVANTNALWQVRGTNGVRRVQRVWSSAGPLQ